MVVRTTDGAQTDRAPWHLRAPPSAPSGPQGMMKGNTSPDPPTAAHALKVYHEILSELDLSGRATRLASDAEALRTRVDLLQEDIVSF